MAPPAPSCVQVSPSFSGLLHSEVRSDLSTYLKPFANIARVHCERDKEDSPEDPCGARDGELIESRLDKAIALVAINFSDPDDISSNAVKVQSLSFLDRSCHGYGYDTVAFFSMRTNMGGQLCVSESDYSGRLGLGPICEVQVDHSTLQISPSFRYV